MATCKVSFENWIFWGLGKGKAWDRERLNGADAGRWPAAIPKMSSCERLLHCPTISWKPLYLLGYEQYLVVLLCPHLQSYIWSCLDSVLSPRCYTARQRSGTTNIPMPRWKMVKDRTEKIVIKWICKTSKYLPVPLAAVLQGYRGKTPPWS